MAIKFEDFIYGIASALASVQRRIVLEQSIKTLMEDFDYEERDDTVPKIRPKGLDLHLKSHDAHVVEQDLIETGEILAFDAFEFDFDTDAQIVEVKDKKEEKGGFYIETTGTTQKGLFGKTGTHINIKMKMKCIPEPQGLKRLKEFFNTELRDDLKGARKHERRS